MNIFIRNAYKASTTSFSTVFCSIVVLNLTVLVLLEAFHPPFWCISLYHKLLSSI